MASMAWTPLWTKTSIWLLASLTVTATRISSYCDTSKNGNGCSPKAGTVTRLLDFGNGQLGGHRHGRRAGQGDGGRVGDGGVDRRRALQRHGSRHVGGSQDGRL